MRKLAKLKAMSGTERWWLLQAWLLLPVVKILLWQIGYRRTVANLERWLPLHSGNLNTGNREMQQLADTFGRLVNGAANHSLVAINCLPRSLVLWWMLRRAGLSADLRIGVQKEAGDFAAHAWIEHCGQVVTENAQVRIDYTPFAESFVMTEKSSAL